jgi:hypothetical protein
MDFKAMETELYEIIKGEGEDIERLESIIESKRQHIADCMKVIYALQEGGFL